MKNMDPWKNSVILVMILAGFICAGKSQSMDNKPPNSSANLASGSAVIVPSANASESEKQAKNPIEKHDNGTAVPRSQTNETNVANLAEFCVLIEFHLRLNLTFASSVDNQTITEQYNITTDKVGNGTNISRSCADQSLTVSWGVAPSTITFKFKTNVTDNTYMLSQIDLFIDVSEVFSSKKAKASQTAILTYTSKDDFKTPIGKSYKCSNGKTLRFNNSNDSTKTVDATISKIHLEAFHKGNETFSSSADCECPVPSSIVDNGIKIVIVVVCCLVVALSLAAIVFFIIRRRAQGKPSIFSACARE